LFVNKYQVYEFVLITLKAELSPDWENVREEYIVNYLIINILAMTDDSNF